MTVIYEVNLSMDKDVEPNFLDWLRPHIQEILNIQGFQSAELLQREEDNPSTDKAYWTVQYRLATREDLEHYFDKHAAAMRADGLKRFGGRFQAVRRVLALAERFECALVHLC